MSADRRMTNQVSVWQAERRSHPTCSISFQQVTKMLRGCNEKSHMSDVSMRMCRLEDTTRKLRGNCSRVI